MQSAAQTEILSSGHSSGLNWVITAPANSVPTTEDNQHGAFQKTTLDTPPKNTSFVHTSASCHQPLLVEGKVRKPTGYRWAVNTQVATPQTFTSLGNTNTPVLPGEAKT